MRCSSGSCCSLSLATRYLLRREALSRLLLFSLPLIDLVLLAVTAFDLKTGTTADFAHGLAAAYVGFTVAFGGIAVSWADRHFAHRFMGAPVPAKAPVKGWPGLRYELILWVRCLVAVVNHARPDRRPDRLRERRCDHRGASQLVAHSLRHGPGLVHFRTAVESAVPFLAARERRLSIR